MPRGYSLQLQCGISQQQQHEIQKVKRTRREEYGSSIKSCSEDVLFEVLKHLDSKSLAIAACVSRGWKRAAEEEALWEGICAKHWPEEVLYASQSGQLRSVVLALGGFRRLYVRCLRPLLDPLHRLLHDHSNNAGEWSKDQVHLSLSLFSIDCYERLGRRSNCPTSLRFLCKRPPHHHLNFSSPSPSSSSSSSSFSLYKGAPASSSTELQSIVKPPCRRILLPAIIKRAGGYIPNSAPPLRLVCASLLCRGSHVHFPL